MQMAMAAAVVLSKGQSPKACKSCYHLRHHSSNVKLSPPACEILLSSSGLELLAARHAQVTRAFALVVTACVALMKAINLGKIHARRFPAHQCSHGSTDRLNTDRLNMTSNRLPKYGYQMIRSLRKVRRRSVSRVNKQ
eukprot:TRINITY_DN46798_c0_g1_i3.p2 TRINITY_DN46798_c0_g1~~TRINITY_DN46798_c0_g1_i3.p2  ORF type:complete len:138 (-),score=19.38 TRINITY_DN46798_c0_g1_i3:170-583(-)